MACINSKSKNEEEIRAVGDKPLRIVLESLGGWPVAVKNWTPPAFSIEYLLGRLRGEYSEPVLVELYVGADDKNSSVNILQVSLKDYSISKVDLNLNLNLA